MYLSNWRFLLREKSISNMIPASPGHSVRQVRNAAWYIAWQRRDDAACGILRYELRVQERGKMTGTGLGGEGSLYGGFLKEGYPQSSVIIHF